MGNLRIDLETLCDDEIVQHLRKLFAIIGIDSSDVDIIFSYELPDGISGITLGMDGFIIGTGAVQPNEQLGYTAEEWLLFTGAHEIQHICDRRAVNHPDLYGIEYDRRADDAGRRAVELFRQLSKRVTNL